MLVWDWTTISRGVSSLAHSRLAPIYNEVAPSIAVFGKLFGKALEAQVGGIACVCEGEEGLPCFYLPPLACRPFSSGYATPLRAAS
jgi:hypothetical protein